MIARCCVLAVLLGGLGTSQELPGTGEFLTDYEIDLLRDRQNFKDRIETYVKFAALRIELIEQQLTGAEEAGRGAKIHRSLEEYSSIIQAVDDVIDDALVRNRKMDGALGNLLASEAQFAARLAAVQAEPAADGWRYEFALEDAIGITRDSMELLAEDLGDRKRAILVQDERDERRRKESMAPARREEMRKESEQREAESDERRSKRPTLLRPGEKAGGRN